MAEPTEGTSNNFNNQGSAAVARDVFGDVNSISNFNFVPVIPDNINFRVETPEANFTGRTMELNELNKIASTSHAEKVAVYGMGGVGKTQLVRQFIAECRNKYRNVIWIDENIEDSLTKLSAEILQLKTTNESGGNKSFNSVIEEVYQKLRERKTLYVFDNVDSIEMLQRILAKAPPPGENPHIIITSRITEWPDGIKVLGLNVWTLRESIDFISKTLRLDDSEKDSDSEKDKKMLAETLQNFPLALRQATAYIQLQREMDDFRICEYIEEFKSTTKEILNSTIFRKHSFTPYQETTYTTWIITMKTIETDESFGRLAIGVLNMMAYFLSDNIDTRWFLDIPCDDQNHQTNEKKRKRRLHSAIQLLVKYSMVDSKDRKGIVGMHRLVQEVIKLKLKESKKEPKMLRNALIMLSKERELNYVARNHKVSVFESALAFPDLIEELSSPPHIETMSLIAACYLHKKKYDEALHLLQQLLELRPGDVGDDHSAIKYNIADVLTKQGQHAGAHQLLEEIYESKKKTCQDDDAVYLKAKSFFATSLYKQGRWEEALKLYNEVHETRKIILGIDHPDTLMAKHNIAMSLHRLEQFSEALQLLREICETKKKKLGDDHPDTLRTKSKMAQQLASLGEHLESLELYREIHEKRKNILGANHVDTLSTKMKMALQYGALREHKESIRLLEEVYKTEHDTLGVDHIATLRTKSRIAEPLAKLGQHDKALQLLQEVFAMQQNKYRDDHPGTITTKKLIAAQHRDMGHETEALQLYQEVYEKQKQILVDNHPDTLNTKSEIDLLTIKVQQLSDAP